MSHASATALGEIVSLWRYPVKSMMGEELNASFVSERGLLGDRAFALLDVAEGRVVSAKNPRKWGRLFDCRASFVEPPTPGAPMPAVRITLPDGSDVRSDQPDVDRVLSETLGQEVRLATTAPDRPTLEEYWPDLEGLPHRDATTDEAMPTGTFFDLAAVHLLTTATLERLRQLYPEGRFEPRRFRPNLVIRVAGDPGFVEDDWIGQSLSLGDSVRLDVSGPCPRCVMTTMPQGDLPKDPGILRSAVQHHGGNVGVYASVVQGGRLVRGAGVQRV